MAKNLGALMGADEDEDGVPTLKPRSAAAKAAKAAQVVAPPVAVAPKRVTIVLEENETIPPTGQFISVQGRSYMLRPGDPASVPVEVLNVLNDAVQEVPMIDSMTNQIVGYRKKMRFPYRIVPDAVAA